MILLTTEVTRPSPLAGSLKQKFGGLLRTDLCLYTELHLLLAQYEFRLSSRRFLQELFEDVMFEDVSRAPRNAARTLKRDGNAPGRREHSKRRYHQPGCTYCCQD